MPNEPIKIVFLGDIIGKPGRDTCDLLIDEINTKYNPDLLIANGENLASGYGISRKVAKQMYATGIDLFTGGNHILQVQDIEDWLIDEERVIIPANFTSFIHGHRLGVKNIRGKDILIISLLGRLFLNLSDNPFFAVEEMLKSDTVVNSDHPIIIVDFHAEATSEKRAMFFHLDGKVSAVLGTHTHIPTADGFVSDKGTAYITDVGMVGAFDSVIGMEWKPSLEIFRTGRRVKLRPSHNQKRRLDGVYIEFSDDSGRALNFKRFTLYGESNI